MKTQSLQGKTVVITGASSGVGKAAAEAFAKEGCNVVLASRGEEALDKAVQMCKDLGATALGIPTDVSDAEQVQSLAEQAKQFNGRIDVWVNNAGVMATGKIEDMPSVVIDQIIKTNLLGYLHGAHAVIPIFKEQQDGVLINNISIGGKMPAPYGTAYSASKFGIRGMVEGLRGEVSHYPNIHISALYPGIQRSTGNMHAAKYSGYNTKIPPISFDPKDLAQTMVSVAKNPRKAVYPDWSSKLLNTIYSIMPRTMVNTSAAAVRLNMRYGDQSETNGNVMVPSPRPHQIYGETMLPVPSTNTKRALLAGALLGIGAVLIRRRF
ncbi:MAG: SDR family oxidoreductase [Weeksellaceae bacterium]|nr:SDR family oxidoreductase [Weeksellaceae bacterium]